MVCKTTKKEIEKIDRAIEALKLSAHKQEVMILELGKEVKSMWKVIQKLYNHSDVKI